ncbi:MAG: hypothetical protein HRT72_07420 [Flavobacteriales bacterium]|nr:hypothetical protein [Flavobacteriales bacterium]
MSGQTPNLSTHRSLVSRLTFNSPWKGKTRTVRKINSEMKQLMKQDEQIKPPPQQIIAIQRHYLGLQYTSRSSFSLQKKVQKLSAHALVGITNSLTENPADNIGAATWFVSARAEFKKLERVHGFSNLINKRSYGPEGEKYDLDNPRDLVEFIQKQSGKEHDTQGSKAEFNGFTAATAGSCFYTLGGTLYNWRNHNAKQNLYRRVKNELYILETSAKESLLRTIGNLLKDRPKTPEDVKTET